MDSIIILGAGAGTRMRSNTPKVLHKISGKSMIEHSLQTALEISDDVHLVLFHKQELIRSHLASYEDKIHFHIQDYANFPGTAGAVMSVTPKYERVYILNGDMPLVTQDDLLPFTSFASDVTMSAMVLDDPKGYGRVLTNTHNEVQKIVEEKDADEAIRQVQKVNAGVYLFRTIILQEFLQKINNSNAQGEYYLTDIIELCLREQKSVSCLEVSSTHFQGVNSKYELSLADETMQKRIKKKWMLEGIVFELADTSYIECSVVFEGECVVESGVMARGATTVKNSHIKAHSVLEDAYLEDSSVGPNARIRPKTRLVQSHIGNFVETKNAQLYKVKAGHLSYIGDAVIDEGTNVGAGFITCNYDGKNKHKTTIGKNVFIGSDTQVVAPITIDDDVLIAAGTTLTKDAKKGELVLARAKAQTIQGYYYKFFPTS